MTSSTALKLCQNAYGEAKTGRTLSTFTQSDWPCSLAMGLMNKVITDMNIKGKYWFMETATFLPFSAGVSTFDLSELGIDRNAITKIQTTSNGTSVNIYNLKALNYDSFSRMYPASQLYDSQPTYFSKYNDTLYLNNAPSKDYGVVVYHMPYINLINNDNQLMECPDTYEMVFQDGVYAYLLDRMQHPGAMGAMAQWVTKVQTLLADVKIDDSLPLQMPRGF